MTAAHGTASRYSAGCRCEPCGAAHSAAWSAWKRSLQDRPSGEIPHGTRSAYWNWGCRCGSCRSAGSDARTGATPFGEIPHGTAEGWKVYRCQCDACRGIRTRARRAKWRRDYHRRKPEDG